MAYRTADQERWKDFDFVVGQRVCLSPTNHPVADICDELKGEYPKDFKFVGWHPHCRCYVESILKSDKELKEDTRRIIRGEQPTDDSTNAVTDTPPNFDAWVKDNRRRIEHAKTPPYFIRDNRSRIDDILNGKGKAQPAAKRIKSPQEVAAERHARRDAAKVQSTWNARRIDRLEELIADGYLPKGVVNPVRALFAAGNITEADARLKALAKTAERHRARTAHAAEQTQKAWNARIVSNLTLEAIRYTPINADIDYYNKIMRKFNRNGDFDGFNEAKTKMQELIDNLRKQYTSDLTFTPEQLTQFEEIEKTLKIKRGKPMTLFEADEQHANPKCRRDGVSPYDINCQTCAPAYVLRAQGFDVTAKGRIKGSGSVNDWMAYSHSFDVWENIDGTPAKPILYREWLNARGYKNMTPKRYRRFYEEETAEPGIYITTIGWKSGGGHATILQRFADGSLAYVDPQIYNGEIKRSIEELCVDGETTIPSYSRRGIMRVDNKILKKVCSYGGRGYDIWSIFEVK